MKNKREQLLQRLLSAEASGRGHHAYLFSGAFGAGANALVEKLAAEWMHTTTQTLALTLHKIQKRIHPDLIWISPEGKTLKVEEIRDLPKQLSFAPLEARSRVVVLSDCEKMSVSAANALLKLIEEPPTSTRFLLLVSDANRMLPTVRSRCQIVRIPMIAASEIRQELENQYGDRHGDLLQEAAGLAGGASARAESYLENEEEKRLVEDAFQALISLWQNAHMVPVEVFQFLDSIKRVDQGQMVLQVWIAQLSDLFKVRESVRNGVECSTDRLIFARFLRELRSVVGNVGEDSVRMMKILDGVSILHDSRTALEGNASVRLTLTNAAFALQAAE